MHALVFIFVFSWGKPLGFIRFQERFITPQNQDSLSGQRLRGFATHAGPPDQHLQHHFIKPLQPQPSGA